MSCEAITAFLHQESGRYLEELRPRRVFAKSPLVSMVKRGQWMPGMGNVITTLQYERSAPTAAVTWSDLTSTPDGQEGGSCLPAAARIQIGSTTRTFNLSRTAFRGPDICNIDTMPAFSLRQQLNNTVEVLADYVKIVWEMRTRDEYFKYCQTKVVMDSCTAPTTTSTMAASYPAAAATQPLHMAYLRQLSIDLMRDGAGAESLLRYNGYPLLTAVCSSETAGNITRDNLAIRDDIRWSNEANSLVRAFGIAHSYGGIVFIPDSTPRRFSYSGGTYTPIIPYTLSDASRGKKAEINSAWKTATCEESFIFDQRVFMYLIPSPPTAPAPEVRFDYVNYVGDLRLLNILDNTCNPLGNIVYHRMDIMAASMPDQPERGVSIVHLRCPPSGCVTACQS